DPPVPPFVPAVSPAPPPEAPAPALPPEPVSFVEGRPGASTVPEQPAVAPINAAQKIRAHRIRGRLGALLESGEARSSNRPTCTVFSVRAVVVPSERDVGTTLRQDNGAYDCVLNDRTGSD